LLLTLVDGSGKAVNSYNECTGNRALKINNPAVLNRLSRPFIAAHGGFFIEPAR
jgi:hypothetical protein